MSSITNLKNMLHSVAEIRQPRLTPPSTSNQSVNLPSFVTAH